MLPAHGTGRYPVRPLLATGAQGRFATSLGKGPDAAGESGASVRCLTLSTALFQWLRTSPDALTERPLQRSVPPWAP